MDVEVAVEIPSELHGFICGLVSAGKYRDFNAAARRGLALIREEREATAAEAAARRALLDEGTDP